jgi:hypothetical protein
MKPALPTKEGWPSDAESTGQKDQTKSSVSDTVTDKSQARSDRDRLVDAIQRLAAIEACLVSLVDAAVGNAPLILAASRCRATKDAIGKHLVPDPQPAYHRRNDQ